MPIASNAEGREELAEAEEQHWEKRQKGRRWVEGIGVQIKPPASKEGFCS